MINSSTSVKLMLQRKTNSATFAGPNLSSKGTVAVTYGAAGIAIADVTAREKSEPRKGLLLRLLEALDETRRRQAERVIARHAWLLAPDHPLRRDDSRY